MPSLTSVKSKAGSGIGVAGIGRLVNPASAISFCGAGAGLKIATSMAAISQGARNRNHPRGQTKVVGWQHRDQKLAIRASMTSGSA